MVCDLPVTPAAQGDQQKNTGEKMQPPKWAGKNWVKTNGQWLPPADQPPAKTLAKEMSWADYKKNQRTDWTRMWFGDGPAPWTQRWYDDHEALIPSEWKRKITSTYNRQRKSDYDPEACAWLEKITSQMRKLILPLSASDEDLIALAEHNSKQCLQQIRENAKGIVTAYQIASHFCQQRNIQTPTVKDGLIDELTSAINRVTSATWWRLRLRKAHTSAIESCARSLGYVCLRDQKYVSDVNLNRRRRQKRRNASIMQRTELTNEAGQRVLLSSAASTNVSNPAIRRTELMTRCRGFEDYANAKNHVALFVTITAPSRYHPVLSISGQQNPNWMGESIKDAQQHLVRCWAQYRAALSHREIKPYGIRVAEPHHDGTPHWHILMFIQRKQLKAVTEKLRTYFLDKHSPDEKGAKENRVKIVRIDRKKGSATGYIAKYISKNIDAHGVKHDTYGDDAKDGSERVEAWAASSRIRQFQQIGGAQVTAWRELRRMQPCNQHTLLITKIREAADQGDWKTFTELAGGATCKRKELTIAIARTRPGMAYDPINQKQVPAERTIYGDQASPTTYGIRDMLDGLSFQSRYHIWTIKRKRSRTGVGTACQKEPWTRENNCTPQTNETKTEDKWIDEYEKNLL